MNRRIESIDYLRAFSALGIVLMHVLANGNFELSGVVFNKIIPSFPDLVFLFMVISGFSMCCGYYKKITNNEISINNFYIKRFKRIWPYFAFLCSIYFILSPSLNTLYEVFANLTLCFGFLPNANISVIGVGWFLGLVFVFYAIFPFYCFLIGTKKRAWLSFGVAIIFNLLCIIYFDVTRTNIVYSSMFFIAGGLIYQYMDEIITLLQKKKLLIITSLIVSLIGYYFLEMQSIWMLLISIELVIICVLNRGEVNSIVSFISNISMEIYLCHMVIYRLIEKLHLIHICSNALISYIFSSSVVFIGAICFTIFSKRILNRIMYIVRKMKK